VLLACCRVEEEVSQKASAVKRSRELEIQLQEMQEDLDAEKSTRSKVERQKRDLGEVRNTQARTQGVRGGVRRPPPNSQIYTKKVHAVCISKIQGSFITL